MLKKHSLRRGGGEERRRSFRGAEPPGGGGSRGNATSSLVKEAGKEVGKSEPATGDSARRQLRESGQLRVTFHVFSTYEGLNAGSTKWSVWLGREAPDTQLTGFAEISSVGGLSYGSGGTSTNQATFENSYLL